MNEPQLMAINIQTDYAVGLMGINLQTDYAVGLMGVNLQTDGDSAVTVFCSSTVMKSTVNIKG